MNRFLVGALGRSPVQASCARALAGFPRATRLLRLVKMPAQAAFIAFVETLLSADPHAPTRCAGWTVHELTAHLTAGSAEIADLVELELAGSPTRPTRDFEEREAPFRGLAPKELRREFFMKALKATVAVDRPAALAGDRRVAFTGSVLDAPTLILHIESELVLHRWDVVGSDDTSVRALSDPRMGLHAAKTVAGMRPNVFPPRSGDCKTVILRSVGAPDIAVTGGDVTTIEPAMRDLSHPVVHCHPAVKTLLLWGRRPEPSLPAPNGEPDVVEAVTAMLRPDGRGYGVL